VAAYSDFRIDVWVTSQTGHSKVSKSRSGSPESSILASQVFAPQWVQGGRTMLSIVGGRV